MDELLGLSHHHDTTEDEKDAVSLALAKEPACGHWHLSRSKLFGDLFQRFKGELTILGFLAMLVWILREAGFWKEFAPPVRKTEKGKYPQDWHKLLELVEDVHMH